jgi:cobalt/nickel transport protein
VNEIDPSYRPWFSPVFRPSSGEIESGLFALQAALGAGYFGFALGRLSTRGRRPAPVGPDRAAGEDGAP